MTHDGRWAACAALAAAAMTLAGCDTPKTASAGNFKKAIAKHFKDDNVMACLIIPRVDKTQIDRPFSSSIPDDIAKLDALADAGFLQLVSRRDDDRSYGQTEYPETDTFILSDSGTALAQKHPITTGGMRSGVFVGEGSLQLCYADVVIDEVTNFTEPNNAFGSTVTYVKFRGHLEHVADWSKTPSVVAAFKSDMDRQRKFVEDGAIKLVLTNDGWTEASDIGS